MFRAGDVVEHFAWHAGGPGSNPKKREREGAGEEEGREEKRGEPCY